MRTPAFLVATTFVLSTAAASAQSPSPVGPSWDEKRISLPLAGTATAYVPRTPAAHVVLFVSGDRGWTPALAGLAQRVAGQQAIVVGLSLRALQRSASAGGGCWYVTSDFELISHAAQKTLNLPQYHAPILVGYGAGASLVYAALANTPATTFEGGISIGFAPTLRVRREICSGDVWTPDYDDRRHASLLPPTRALPRDWYLIQGTTDRASPIDAVRRFVTGMPKTHLVEVDGAVLAAAKPMRWGPSFDKTLRDLWTHTVAKPASAQARSASTQDLEAELQRLQLPLEFRWPAQLSALMLFFSGDGGWASLDEDTAELLVAHGVGIVGVSSLRYFWNARSPAQVAVDLHRLVVALERSGKPLFAGGFSFGAEIVPVALKEWPPEERRALHGLVLVSPGTSASFEIDPLDWVRTPAENPATRVAPAVRDVGLPTLCLAGSGDDDSACPSLNGAAGVRVVRLPGSHHFNDDYAAVADAVRQFIRITQAERHP